MMEPSDTADTALNEALSMLDSLTTDGAGFAIDSDDDDENFNIDDELNQFQLQLEGVDLADDKMEQDNNLASNNNIDMNIAPPPPLTTSLCHPLQLQDNMNIDISCVDQLALTSDGQSQPSKSSRAPPHGHGQSTPNTFTTNANNLTVTNNNVVTMSTTTTADISLNANHSQSNTDTAASCNNHRSSSWTSSFASFAKVASQSIQSAVESAEATLVHQGEPLPLNRAQLNSQNQIQKEAKPSLRTSGCRQFNKSPQRDQCKWQQLTISCNWQLWTN